ncbi:thioesterase II family protein [Pseudomonas aeruginosa]|uniref:thioesterase II family protein n=1 Tax=Pseudomonas aeruginosa TaxID=287 RepID=UPI002440F1E2|nr:alpha/beta fold hydrolase [Pseudomonas aeruginosa]
MGGTPVRLFCLPYSGASAMTYSRWRRKLPAWLAVRPVELPGRGARMAEPLQTDLASLAQQLARELHDEVRQGPYAMLGHSLGALLACEVLYALRELGCPTPLGFFACGTAAPSRRAEYDRGFAEPKSDAELIADLRDLQGTPEEVLGNRELMSLTRPGARGRAPRRWRWSRRRSADAREGAIGPAAGPMSTKKRPGSSAPRPFSLRGAAQP